MYNLQAVFYLQSLLSIFIYFAFFFGEAYSGVSATFHM